MWDSLENMIRYTHKQGYNLAIRKAFGSMICKNRNAIASRAIEINARYLLFVDSDFHRRGISRELLRRALDICCENRPDLSEVSVNSSPFAIPVYQKLGFQITGPEQTVNGIRFQPMVLNVERI